jgi:hypothetical protein
MYFAFALLLSLIVVGFAQAEINVDPIAKINSADAIEEALRDI